MFEKIKQFFSRGGGNVQRVNSLGKIIDHPKINMTSEEYERIQSNSRYYAGLFDNVRYKNTYGVTKTRPFVSLNMAQVVAKRIASICLNEHAVITVGTEDSEAQKFINETFKDNDFYKSYERYLESGMALGGMAIKPYVDDKQIKLSWIQADAFYPLRSNSNNISGVAIASVTTKVIGKAINRYTLLEFHEWKDNDYIITNELYCSVDSADVVGKRVPLSELYPDLEEETHSQGVLTRMLPTYFKPAGMNNKDRYSLLGLSVTDNAKNTLKQIDDSFDKLNWEVKMSQKKVTVSADAIQVIPDENNQAGFKQIFDSEQDVFLSLDGGLDDKSPIKDISLEPRVEPFISSISTNLKLLEMQVGLSSGTFTFDSNGLKTATEVVSENSMTYQTRNSHLTNVEQNIKELVTSILELAKSVKLYNGPTDEEITIDFDDAIFVDKQAQATYLLSLLSSGLISKKYFLTKQLGVTDEEAEKMLTDIDNETINQQPDQQEQNENTLLGSGDE